MKQRRLISIILVTIGFTLSPLTWWNDLFVNVPLAYLLTIPFTLITEQLFLPTFIIAYWLTNLLGFLLLHWGSLGLLNRQYSAINIRHSLLISVVYTAIILLMVILGWLAPPTHYLEKFS